MLGPPGSPPKAALISQGHSDHHKLGYIHRARGQKPEPAPTRNSSFLKPLSFPPGAYEARSATLKCLLAQSRASETYLLSHAAEGCRSSSPGKEKQRGGPIPEQPASYLANESKSGLWRRKEQNKEGGKESAQPRDRRKHEGGTWVGGHPDLIPLTSHHSTAVFLGLPSS